MGNELAQSFIGAESATAFAEGTSPERMSQRSLAYAEKEKRDQALRTLKATEPTEQDRAAMAQSQTLELQNAITQQQEMQRQGNKAASWSAFERYDTDRDPRHINTMLQQLNERGSPLFGGITRVDKFTDTEEDRKILKAQGFEDDLINEMINNPDMNHSYVKITTAKGDQTFGDMDALKAVTYYNRDYATNRELERQKGIRELEHVKLLGFPPTKLSTEALRLAEAEIAAQHGTRNINKDSPEFLEAFNKHYQYLARKQRFGSSGFNETEAEAYGRRWAQEQGYSPGDPEWESKLNEGIEMYSERVRPSSAIRNTNAATEAEERLDEAGYLDKDLSTATRTELAKYGRDIRIIEGPGGGKLSAAHQKTLGDIRRLTSLGGLASELTDDQTGLVDSMFRKVKKYISDDVSGVEAEAAYSAYRNLVMHALYGASLQPGEASKFTDAFGSLKHQRGPALVQLRVSLEEIKDAYEGIVETNNQYVIKHRTGRTSEELYDVISSLDERIEMLATLESAESGAPVITVIPESKGEAILTPEVEAELDLIFNPPKGGGGR